MWRVCTGAKQGAGPARYQQNAMRAAYERFSEDVRIERSAEQVVYTHGARWFFVSSALHFMQGRLHGFSCSFMHAFFKITEPEGITRGHFKQFCNPVCTRAAGIEQKYTNQDVQDVGTSVVDVDYHGCSFLMKLLLHIASRVLGWYIFGAPKGNERTPVDYHSCTSTL